MKQPIQALFKMIDTRYPESCQNFALEQIAQNVDVQWYLLVDKIKALQSIVESQDFHKQTRSLAALALSKLYYCTEKHDLSVEYALQAIPAFNFASKDTYTVSIVSKIVDAYISQRHLKTNESLEIFFNHLFESWCVSCVTRTPRDMAGLALQARRLDLFENVLSQSKMDAQMITACHNHALNYVPDIEFREKVIQAIIDCLPRASLECWPEALRCALSLARPQVAASLMIDAASSGKSYDECIALQIAVEIREVMPIDFSLEVLEIINNRLENLDSGIHCLKNVKKILEGKFYLETYGNFLFRANTFDLPLLNGTKKHIEGKNIVLHNALVTTNAFIYSGTTIDEFLRKNIPWLGKASHWAKFIAVASLGSIYKGSIDSLVEVLKAYLPKKGSTCPYQEGGSLLALGLSSASIGRKASAAINGSVSLVKDFIMTTSQAAESKPQAFHGGALALGLLLFETADEDAHNLILSNLLLSEAQSGEACAVALGMLKFGKADEELIATMLSLVHDKDQKEKIIRGASMCIALTNYGKGSAALATANEMLADKDQWIRMGGCMTIALAFAGSGNMHALETLLVQAVQDTVEDVRRTAMLCVGFITFRDPKIALDVLQDFSGSYNLHIRYGVAMALGIAGSGSGDEEISKLLWKMTEDASDFVRQGAMIALAMVLIQKSPKENETVQKFRTSLTKKIADRHVDVCTKFGCIIAQGIIDAGGQNCTISLVRNSRPHELSIACMFVFSQYWFWFPYTLFLSQCFSVRCFIGLNKNLEMPKCQLRTSSPLDQFKPFKPELTSATETRKSNTPVELSTTKREKEIAKTRETNMPGAEESENSKSTAAKAPEDKSNSHADDSANILQNPCRVTDTQVSFVALDEACGYQLIKSKPHGFCILHSEHEQVADTVEMRGNPLHDDSFAPPEDFIL